MKNLKYDHLGGGPEMPKREIKINKKRVLKTKPKKLFAMENFSCFLENQEDLEKEKIVRKGLNIDDNFWDNFIRICGDSNALSKLLNVPKEKISSWSSIIQNKIQEINKKDKNISSSHKKLI